MKTLKHIARYLRPFWLVFLVIIALTYAQVQLDLTLPDRMSDIVTNGIQYGGIKDSLPKVLSAKTYEAMVHFMQDADAAKFTSAYTPYEKGERAPVDGIEVNFATSSYVLKDDYDKDLAKIELEPFIYANLARQNDIEINEQNAEVLALMLDETLRGQESSFEAMAKTYLRDEYALCGVTLSTLQTNYILNSGLLMLGIALLCALTQVISTYLATKLAARVAANIRKDIFKKVEGFSGSDMDKFSTSSLITRTTNDVTQLQQLIQMLCRIILIAPMMGIVSISKVMRFPDLIWILVVALTFISIVMLATLVIAMPKFQKIQGLVDRLNRVMREFLDGMLVIRAFGSEKLEEKRFDGVNDEYRRTDLFVSRVMSFVMPLLMFVMNMVTVLVIWFGASFVDINVISVGEIMAFIQYAMQVIMSFMIVAMIWIMIPRALVSVRRIFEVLDTDYSIKDIKEPIAMPQGNMTLAFENVSFAYPGADECVLEDITFSAKPNETVAFIGSTGSGKSTLVKLIVRLFDVTAGKITYGGNDIRLYRQADLREKIGYVPQKALLFSGTIRSNIEFGKEVSTQMLQRAIEISQSQEIVAENSQGLDTPITQGGTNVSGGQRQRLSIARALAKDPSIYIFDDSFSALDYATDKKLRKALNDLISEKKATVLIVAQRIATIRDADKIIVLNEGKIAGIGKHNELLKTCEVYREIAASQLNEEELADA